MMNNLYKNPGLTADVVVFGFFDKKIKILLIQRGINPFKDCWAIPGGFVNYEEEILIAAKRELEEETGIKGLSLTEFKTVGKLGRDPRGRTVSVVYYTFCDGTQLKPKAADDAKNVKWFDLNKLPELAFDHDEILVKLKSHIKFLAQKLNVEDFSAFTETEKNLSEKIKAYFSIH